MKPDCRNFRARLADALRGPLPAAREPVLGGLNGLGWHRHVIHCAACRELLSEEEALDELLRSLPQPHLPRALAERVLSRLEGARRGVDLDRLLDLPNPEPAPADLAQNVLARVHAEQGLDRLLERVPAASVPAGFERRILARLELARRSKVARTRTRPAIPVRSLASAKPGSASFRLPLRIAAGIALASLAGWGLWTLRRNSHESALPSPMISEDTPSSDPSIDATPQRSTVPAVPNNDATAQNSHDATALPDEQLLASLDVFEAWDLLASADGLDASLSTFDSFDEYLLDFEAAAQPTESAPAADAPAGAPDSDPKNTKKNG